MEVQPTNQLTPVATKVWQLVINHPFEEVKVLIPYLEKKCDRFVASEHEADEQINRTHVHFSLVNYKHTDVSLTKEINKNWRTSSNFGLLLRRPAKDGGGDYDEIILAQYVGKGREDAFSVRGHSFGYGVRYLQDFKTNYSRDKQTEDTSGTGTNAPRERVINRIQYKLKVESPAEQRVRKWDFVKRCIAKLKEKYPEKTYEPRDVFIVIREELNELHWTVGNYTVMEYYDTINRMETPGRWIDEMMGLLEKRKPRV